MSLCNWFPSHVQVCVWFSASVVLKLSSDSFFLIDHKILFLLAFWILWFGYGFHHFPIVSQVIKDATQGSEPGKTISLYLLDALICVDHERYFLSQLQSRGFLRSCFTSISNFSYQVLWYLCSLYDFFVDIQNSTFTLEMLLSWLSQVQPWFWVS